MNFEDAEKCYALALEFEQDDDGANELAEKIQQVIDDWISYRANRNEAAYERQQEALMEGGGPDDSAYRRSLIEAGRGHLLK